MAMAATGAMAPRVVSVALAVRAALRLTALPELTAPVVPAVAVAMPEPPVTVAQVLPETRCRSTVVAVVTVVTSEFPRLAVAVVRPAAWVLVQVPMERTAVRSRWRQATAVPAVQVSVPRSPANPAETVVPVAMVVRSVTAVTVVPAVLVSQVATVLRAL